MKELYLTLGTHFVVFKEHHLHVQLHNNSMLFIKTMSS